MLRGTTVARRGRAAIIRGASGSGKSDLALRCIGSSAYRRADSVGNDDFALVSDDQTAATLIDGAPIVSAPPVLFGRLEVRGLGIVDVPAVNSARLVLAVELTDDEIERMPEVSPRFDVLGHALPTIRLRAFEASAPLKLGLALELAAAGISA